MRAFVALPLAPAVRERLAAAIDAVRGQPWADAVRWVPAENLHLTLRFLGEVAEEAVPELLAALRTGVGRVESFDCELGESTFFPHDSRPRVVAARVAPEADLAELARAVESAVVALGFEAEPRPFRAHITLGRLARGGRRGKSLRAVANADLNAANGPLEAARLEVRQIVLYQSVLGQRGARYHERGRAALSQTGAETTPPDRS